MLTYTCPFQESEGMIRFLRNNSTVRNKDWWFFCEGPEGSGKSTTKDQIMARVDPRQSREDAIMDIKHLMDVFEDFRKNQFYNIDEGIIIFHNQDWATWQAKLVSKIIRIMRIMRSTWGIAGPDFEGMHPYLRDFRIRQRFYHRPVFDEDGMGNGPPMPLWKDEWFDFKQQRRTTRWKDLEFDLQIEPFEEEDPVTKAYEGRKEQLFKDLVKEFSHRFGLEEEKERRQADRMLNGSR